MEFQLPGMNPPPPGPPGGPGMPPTSEEQSFLGALTSPDHALGPPGFPPPGGFHPGFPPGPPGPPMG